MHWMTLAFCSLVLTGLGNFCIKWATSAGQSPWVVVIGAFMINALLAVGVWLWMRPTVVWAPVPIGATVLTGLGTGLGVLLLVRAIGQPGSQAGVATAVMNANFALVTLLAWLVFQETLSLKQLCGLAAMIIGLILLM